MHQVKSKNLYPLALLVVFSMLFTTEVVQAQGTIEEVVVTGSFIKRKDQSESTSPIQVIGFEDLDNVAAFNADDLVATLTVNNGSQNQNDGFNQSFSLGTTNVNLRGLGVSSTLTLLNGRRQTLTAATTLQGDQFVDLNSLVPRIAVERVEVLEDGASSLYGSDAVAGVVNFITRKDFEGVEVDVNYISTTSDAQDDVQASALFGKNFGATHMIGAFSYFNRSELSAADRVDEFELRNAGSIFGQPGTYLVFPAFPPPPPPVRTPDPSCAAQAAANPTVVTGIIPAGPIAGTCNFDFGDFFRLVAKEERFQGYAELNVELSDTTELFAEFGYTHTETESSGSPSQPVLFPPVVPATNPAIAALGGGARALWFGRVDGAGAPASLIDLEHDTFRIAGGTRGEFANNWSWETGITYSQNDYSYLNRSDTLRDRFQAALNGVGGPNNNQFFNPLFGATNDPAVREDFRGLYFWDAESSLFTVDGHITGEVLELPAGSVGFALGFQYRKDKLKYDYNPAAEQDNLFFFIGNRDFSGEEDVYAFFVETDIPVFENFDIQFALRYEDFGDIDTLDPKVGFRWQPLEELSFRGTYGTSFRTPSIFQKNGRFNVPARIFDPNAGGLATIAQQTTGDPAQALEPQTSNTYNLGATWSSDELGLTASIDYWRFEYENFITPENATALVAANPNGPQVTRNAITGALLTVTTFFRNAAQLTTDGIDVSIKKDFTLDSAGDFAITFDMTRIISYDLEDPIAGPIDGLGSRNFTNFGVPTPQFRGNVGLLWSKERHSGNLFVRYIDSYDDDNTAGNKISDFTSLDMQYRYQFSPVLGTEEGPAITLGARNILDKMPPDVVSRTGYDALTHSPLGRQVYFAIKQAF